MKQDLRNVQLNAVVSKEIFSFCFLYKHDILKAQCKSLNY